jgi:hypothetical protein
MQAGCLAGPVQAHDEQPLAPLHREADIPEHGGAPVALREPIRLEHDLPGVRRFGEPVADPALACGAVHGRRLEAGGPRVQGLGLAGPLGRLAPHRVGERLQAPDLGLLAFGDGPEAGLVLPSGLPVLGVGAPVLDDPLPVEVQDPGDRRVEQREIVADDDERASVRREEAHQPVFGVAVQVVRGLVEQQDVRAGEEDPCELEPPPLPTRERGDRQVQAVLRQAEADGDPPRLGLTRVAAGGPVPLLEAGEPTDVGLGGALLDGEAGLLRPLRQLEEASCLQHVHEAGVLVLRTVLAGILSQVAEAALHHDPPRDGLLLPREDLQQARLARAVAAHDTDLVAGAQGERQALQQRPAGRLDREVADLERAHDAGSFVNGLRCIGRSPGR